MFNCYIKCSVCKTVVRIAYGPVDYELPAINRLQVAKKMCWQIVPQLVCRNCLGKIVRLDYANIDGAAIAFGLDAVVQREL